MIAEYCDDVPYPGLRGVKKLNLACGEQFPLTKGGSANGAGVVRQRRKGQGKMRLPFETHWVKAFPNW